MNKPVRLGRAHRLLIATVVAGTLVIAGIGFAGSYAAVRELALNNGFGNFSYVFPSVSTRASASCWPWTCC
jgi:diacylglycerol kinase family enzyme